MKLPWTFQKFPGANQNCFCPVSAISQRFIFIGAFIGVPETETDALREDEDERDDERAFGSIFVRSVFVLSVVTRRVP